MPIVEPPPFDRLEKPCEEFNLAQQTADDFAECRHATHRFVESHFNLPMQIPIKLLSAFAKIPTQTKPGDAGYDLYSAQSMWIKPGQRSMIKTGIAMAIPNGYFGRICGRSGLALKNGIQVLGGILDAPYRGEVGVILLNTADGGEENSFQVRVGDRIAQLIIEKCHEVQFVPVDDLGSTERASGGFGSSGA